MKIEFEVDDEELRQAIIAHIAREVFYSKYEYSSRDALKEKIMNSIDWKRITPAVQDAILKMAAEKVFK